MNFNLYAPYISAAEAAELCGLSYRRILRAVRCGDLPARRMGRMALILPEDLERWKPGEARPARAGPRAAVRPTNLPANSSAGGAKRSSDEERQREFLERLISVAPIGIAVLEGPGYRVRLANGRHCLLQCFEQMLGRPFLESLPAPIGPEFAATLERARTTHLAVYGSDFRVTSCDAGAPDYYSFIVQPLESDDSLLLLLWETTGEVETRRRIAGLARHAQEQRNLLATVMNTAPIGLAIADDPSCSKVRLNATGARLLRVPEGATISLSDDVEADACARLLRAGTQLTVAEMPMRRAASENRLIEREELELVWDDGEVHWLDTSAAPLRDESGTVTGAVAAFRDITRRKRAEQALAGQTAILQATIESLPDGVVITDVEGRAIWCNPVMTEIMGCVPEDTAERVQRWDVRDADGVPLRLDDAPALRAARGAAVRNLLLRARRPDGQELWVRAGASPIRLPDGRIQGAVVVLRDVTEEEQQRQNLARERARLQALIESSPEGIVMADAASGTIELCNTAAEKLLDRPGLRGVKIEEYGEVYHLLTPDGKPVESEALSLARSLRGEICQGMEKLVVHPCGARTSVLVNSAPLRDERGAIIGAIEVLHDITVRKERERQRDSLISMAAHELRSPLTAIRGNVQLLQRQARQRGAPEDVLNRLKAIIDQADHLGALIAEMLDMSRLQLGRLEVQRAPTDLTALAARAVEQVRVTAPGHRFRLEAPGPVVGAWDAFRLEQVFTNLLTNAVKYSPAGGGVTVTISAPDDPAAPVEAAVIDEGIGIPPGQEEVIFQEFARAENTQQQTRQSLGLGLYIARGIVERHGGRLWAESAGLGRGSAFRIRLPR